MIALVALMMTTTATVVATPSGGDVEALVGTAVSVAQTDDDFDDFDDLDGLGDAAGEAVENAQEAMDDADDGLDTISEPAAPVTPPRADTPAADGAPRRDGNYVLRLRELEDQLNDLKEEIFRSKSRLVLLRERVLGTRIGGAQAVLTHVNDMGATFTVQRVVYVLDGQQLYVANDDDGELDDREEIELYNGSIVPGTHNLAVEIEFVGNGFGLFSYLEGYRMTTRSSTVFVAEDGKVADIRIVAFEEGGINQPMEERPTIRFDVDFVDNVVAEE